MKVEDSIGLPCNAKQTDTIFDLTPCSNHLLVFQQNGSCQEHRSLFSPLAATQHSRYYRCDRPPGPQYRSAGRNGQDRLAHEHPERQTSGLPVL
jgi:hypothetical protein